MRKTIKIVLSALFFLFVLPLRTVVDAQENKITSIDIEVQLHEDGSATVLERRQMELVEGTEVYIVLENLNETDLLDFEVAGFTEEADWDIDVSFEEKANKYGVIETDDGYELAWGVTEYGSQEYEVRYSLSNLVRNLEDGQALFWNFDTFLNVPTDRLQLEVHAPFPLEEELLEYFGFGFEGPIGVNDGVFEWTGFGLDSSNDIIVLLQFPEGVFATSASEEMTLEEQREMALEGSSYNVPEPMPFFLKVIFGLLGLFGVGAAGMGVAYGVRHSKIRKEHDHFNAYKMVKENEGRVSSTPPHLEEDTAKYAYLISKISRIGGGFSEYFFAYLMVWSAQERIHIETSEEDRAIFGSKTKTRIYIHNFEEEYDLNRLDFEEYVELFKMGQSTFEEVIWGILLEAADRKGVIEDEDIREWSSDHAETVSKLVDQLEEVSKDWLVANGYLKLFTVKDWGVPIKIEQLTEKGKRTAVEIIRFDAFIENIDEVPIDDYDNWEDLIIWAALLGHAEDTIEYLEEFEPSTWAYLEETYPYMYGNYYGYYYFYTAHTSGLSSGGYSSGGGGFSSGGGGMGAGGGGGGGVR